MKRKNRRSRARSHSNCRLNSGNLCVFQSIRIKSPSRPRERDERLPSLNILLADQNTRPDERTINQTAGMIEKTLAEFGIVATVIGFRVGPTVTQFAVQPGFMKRGNATYRGRSATDQSARGTDRFLAERSGAGAFGGTFAHRSACARQAYVGIEVPNTHSSVVRMRSILETDAFHKIGAPLAMALGRDVSGQPVVADLSRMPHLVDRGRNRFRQIGLYHGPGGLSGDE